MYSTKLPSKFTNPKRRHSVKVMKLSLRKSVEEKISSAFWVILFRCPFDSDIDSSISVKANIHASDGDRLSETELIGQITYIYYLLSHFKSYALMFSLLDPWRLRQRTQLPRRWRVRFIYSRSIRTFRIVCARSSNNLELITTVKIYHTTHWFNCLILMQSVERPCDCKSQDLNQLLNSSILKRTSRYPPLAMLSRT